MPKATAARPLTRFGTPGSICPMRLFSLPRQMQTEGLLLLFEMGETTAQISARTGLSAREIDHMVNDRPAPFTRPQDKNAVLEGWVG